MLLAVKKRGWPRITPHKSACIRARRHAHDCSRGRRTPFRRWERHDFLGHRLTPRADYANIGMYQRMKALTWLADSRSRVKSFPAGVQDDIGYALYAAQLGEMSVKAKPLHGLADR